MILMLSSNQPAYSLDVTMNDAAAMKVPQAICYSFDLYEKGGYVLQFRQFGKPTIASLSIWAPLFL